MIRYILTRGGVSQCPLEIGMLKQQFLPKRTYILCSLRPTVKFVPGHLKAIAFTDASLTNCMSFAFFGRCADLNIVGKTSPIQPHTLNNRLKEFSIHVVVEWPKVL